MHVGDAIGVAAGGAHRIAAGKRQVPGIEQQRHGVVAGVHQPVHFVLGLHDRAHVVMVGEGEAGVLQACTQLLEARGELRPVGGREHGALREPLAAVAMDAARRLGHDHDLAAERGEQLAVRAHGLEFRGRVALEQGTAVPTGNQRKSVRGERCLELRRGARELAAELDALEARGPRFGEAGLERRLAADLGQVVDGPGERVDAEADAHAPPSPSTLLRQAACAAWTRASPGDFRNRHVPPGAAGGGAALRIGLDHEHGRALRAASLRDRRLQRREVGNLRRVGAERACVRHEIDRRLRRERILQQVVVFHACGRTLQAVDAAVPAVVAEHDEERVAAGHRSRDLGVHHQVAAVAQQDGNGARGIGHLHAETARDLVAHAGIAVLEVIAAGLGAAPELVQLARQAAGGRDQGRALAQCAIDRAEHLRVGGKARARARCGVDDGVPFPDQVARALAPGRLRRPAGERGPELAERREHVTAQGEGPALDRVVAGHVDRDQAIVEVADQLAGPGGEVLQARAEREHEVGFREQPIGGARAGDAEAAGIAGVVERERALARLRLRDRDAVARRELRDGLGGLRVVHAAAGDDEAAGARP